MIERDAAIARYEGGRLPHPAPVGAPSRCAAVERAKRQGVEVTAEVTPHHLTLTDEAVRSLDPRFKMNPPLRGERDRAGADRGPALGSDRLHRDRPRAALARGEGGAVRAGADGRDRARDGVRGCSTRSWSCPGVIGLELLVERMTAGACDLRPADADAREGLAGRTSAWSTSRPSGRWGRPATRAAPRTPASPAASCEGRVLMTVAAGIGRLPRARLRDQAGRRRIGLAAARGAQEALEAGPRARRARRWSTSRRRSGRPCSTSTGRAATPACWCRARNCSACRCWSPSSTRRGSAQTVPEVAEHLDGVDADREGVLQRRRLPRGSPRACARPGATRCCSAASSRTSA